MEEAQKPKVFYGYVIVVACFFIMTIYWGTTLSYGIFFNSLIKEFGWTRAATSGAYSVMALMFGLTGIIIAKLCDKYGPRIVIGTCGVLMGIGYILLSRINVIWQLYLYYGVFIAIGMCSYISLLPMVTRWFTRRRALMIVCLIRRSNWERRHFYRQRTRMSLSKEGRTSFMSLNLGAFQG